MRFFREPTQQLKIIKAQIVDCIFSGHVMKDELLRMIYDERCNKSSQCKLVEANSRWLTKRKSDRSKMSRELLPHLEDTEDPRFR